MDTTLDGLLDRRVALEQPAKGYRVAVDTVLLAAAVPAHAGEAALDLGCGVGGAMLGLACRVPGIAITGVEIKPELVEIARRNIARNAFQSELKIMQGDVTRLFENDGRGGGRRDSPPLEGGVRGGVNSRGDNPPPNLPLKGGGIETVLPASFDHVLINPPYHDEATHDVSPDALKRAANTEKTGDLLLWLASAAKSLRAQGTLTLIHRADRLEEILALMAAEGFGGVEAIFAVARLDDLERGGKRRGKVLLRARKNGLPQGVRYGRPLILHQQTGDGYSGDAEAILRHMKPVSFDGTMP